MAGSRHGTPDRRYYTHTNEGRAIVVTRLLNWLESGNITHALFHIADDIGFYCSQVILVQTGFDVQPTSDLTLPEGVIDMHDQAWLFLARYSEEHDGLYTAGWYILHVEQDILTFAEPELLQEVLNHRAQARAGWPEQTVT